MAHSFNLNRWMSNTLNIDQLKLTDIVWPGTHNSGMDKKAPNYDVIFGNWTTCQNDSFTYQLANGARAFDIRLGYRQALDQSIFFFHHNGFQSHRVLYELTDAIVAFLDRNPDEFIVLDFHELGVDHDFFPYDQFSAFLTERLGPRIIHAADADKTVGELKQASQQRRVVLAASHVRGMNENLFWPKVHRKWSRKNLSNADELQSFIGKTLEDAPVGRFLWALSATTYSALGGPQDVHQQINEWFHASRDWVTRCSIISTDFFEESDIVRYCWIATSMKAVYGETVNDR